MLNRNNVSIITKEPTRNDARLDCFISNDQEKIIDDGVTNPHLSDHLCCFITRKCLIEKTKSKTIMRRNYNKINLTNLANLVVNANFRSDGSPEEQLQHFINKLVKIFDTVAPVKPKKIRDTKKKLTLTENTKQLMRRRDQLYSTMRNQPESKAEYSILKKKIRKKYEDTRKWVNSSIENKGLWSTMKIIKPTEPEKSKNQTPDKLNHYFNSNTNPMERQHTVTTPPEANQNPIMKLHSVTAVDLFQAWKTIKNKTNTKEDYNGISLAMLILLSNAESAAQMCTMQ